MKQTIALFLGRVVASTLAMALTLIAIGAFLFWVTGTVDEEAAQRERDIGELAISEILYDISHDQESTTFWDDAVQRTSEPGNEEWIDGNLGTWMHTFYGMDELFVLDGRYAPIYSFAEGAIQPLAFFDARASLVRPLLKKLRSDLSEGVEPVAGSVQQSIGVADFAVIDGRPVVVSLKPILSDSGNLVQKPEEICIHVAIRYLDGPFIDKMGKSYVLDGLKVFRAGDRPPEMTGFVVNPVVSGEAVEFAWVPFEPGKSLIGSIWPVLSLVSVLLLVGTLLLSSVSYRQKVDRLRNDERIRYLSSHDALTDLLNRTAYEAAADLAVAAISDRPTNDLAAFLFMDLDRFKQVNDIFGHPVGDAVLVEFARRATAILPEGASLFRVGGDEFAILVPRCSQPEIEALCERVINCLDEPVEVGARRAFVGVSIGVSFAPLHGTDQHELIRKADVAMYYAKTAGRGRFSIFGSQMDDSIQSRAEVEAQLRAALVDKTQFQVFYQPKYACGCPTPRAVEALARWNHPVKGMISPATFIPVAEASGLIGELGLWILTRACEEALHWPLDHLAVNVSPRQLQDRAFASEVSRILTATGYPADRLELELTETAIATSGAEAIDNIAALSAMGVAIAIDDFGTGSSTFERLRELTFDRIKIDQSFVRMIADSKSDAEIVRAMIALAHAKGLQTTAEGIETSAQKEMVCALGCDELQGFLLGKPMPADQISGLFGAELSGPGKA